MTDKNILSLQILGNYLKNEKGIYLLFEIIIANSTKVNVIA